MSKIKDLGNDLYSGTKSIDIVGRRKVFYLNWNCSRHCFDSYPCA
jgi:hypothetical protein